jgi:hypothetical protein
MDRMQGLLDAGVAVSREVELPAVLLGAAVSERAGTGREIAQVCGQLAERATRIATSDHRPALPGGRSEQERAG